MNSHKVINFFIKLCIFLFSFEGLAADYGVPCKGVSMPVDTYLEQNTAYGHIKYSIDIINVPGACNSNDSKISFCLKNKDGTCKTITMNLDDSQKLSALSTDNNPDLGANPLLADIILSVKVLNDMFCLTMPTSKGIMPLTCRPTTLPPSTSPDEECRYIGKTCYMGTSNSQSLFNFSGLAVDCVKETLDQVFFQYTSCDPSFDKVSLLALNPFSAFQETLKKSIGAALILYVMFFGVDMILNKKYGNIDKIAIFVLKIILVLYFAVGLGAISFTGGKETQENGMLAYGLPFLNQATPEFAQIVFDAGGARGLCEFDIKKYKPGYQFYALWDSIDCRIAYYLGMGIIDNVGSQLHGVPSTTPNGVPGTAVNIKTSYDRDTPETLKDNTSFRFFTVMFGFLSAGNILVVVSGIVFCVVFVSILLQFISTYIVCMVTIYVMTYISPIFIPMVLFNRTKAYFDAWLKICFSCALQPAVMAGFIALLVTLYDSAIYKNCEFARHDYVPNDKNGAIFSTFEIRLPDKDPDECKSSAGYKLLQYYSGTGWEKHLLILFRTNTIRDVLSLIVDLIYVLVFSILFYYFSKVMSQFAADVTSGPRMDAVTASPTKIVDMVKKGMEYIKDAVQAANGKPPEGGDPADKLRAGGEKGGDSSSASYGAGDKESGSTSKAGDKMSGGSAV